LPADATTRTPSSWVYSTADWTAGLRRPPRLSTTTSAPASVASRIALDVQFPSAVQVLNA
jgi:hypothetical protein